MAEELISVKNLVKKFPVNAGIFNTNIGERAIALLVDIVLLFIINLLIFGLLFSLIGVSFSWWIQGLANIIIGWLYFALPESSNKRGTIGKMIMKVKVADLNGNKLSLGKATLRFLIKIISLPTLIGLIMPFFNDKKQTLHDILAKTLVTTKSQIEGKTYVHAVDNISFNIYKNEVLGLVGESGSGKSTAGRLLLNLLKQTDGQIIYNGEDLSILGDEELRCLRKQMTMVFQDPNASLSPRMSVGEAISHPLKIHQIANEEERKEQVLDLMRKVGLEPAEFLYKKYPHQLSGGQSQRVVFARALITNPDFIVADEPISMADVSVRALIMDLMKKLKDEFNLTYLFITHDLATAKYLCNRIAVMYLGRIIEIGSKDEIFSNPHHPYTKALLEAVPVPDPSKRRTKEVAKGEIPSAINPPSGCHFHPRCPYAMPECKTTRPNFKDISKTHKSACLLSIDKNS